MGLLIIDAGKCKRDGLCVRECAASIIRLPEGNATPETIPEGVCLECGHCIAVCPPGALSHRNIPTESSHAILDELRISEEQAIQFLRSRRSVRHFKDMPVDRERIEKLIQAARYAPTAGNSQMVEWVVLTDKAHIRNIATMAVDWVRMVVKDPRATAASPYLPAVVERWDAGYDSILRGAPVLIVASAPKEAVNGMVDLTLALSYLDLLAPTMGLGTCWAGLLHGAMLSSPAIKRAAGIPEGHPHHYPMMLGLPDIRYYRSPDRRAPKITYL